MKKALKNIFASALPQIVNIIANLILPGIIIVKFGSEVNGLVSTTKTIVSYIGLVGAGIATAVTQSLYSPVAKKNDAAVNAILNAAGNMFNKYGFIFCSITFAVALIYPFTLKTDIPYITIASLLLVISLSGASEFFAIGRYRALLYANQQVYVCTLIQAASLLISLVFALILLNSNIGIVLVQLAVSLVYVLHGVFLFIYVRHNYPQYSNYKRYKPINEAIQKRNDAMIHQISGVVVAGSQAAILSVFVNLQSASIFAVYNIVFSGLQSICANLSTAVTPFLGRKLALGENSELNKLYDVIEYSFFALVALVFSVASVMLLPFISIYTRNADINYIYPSFAVLFIFSSAFYILKLPSVSLINIAGHFKETRKYAIVEMILSISVSVIMTILIGKDGVLIGAGCAMGWRCLVTIIYTNKQILKARSKKSIIRLTKALGMISAFCICSNLFTIKSANYSEWVILAITISAIAIVLIFADAYLFENRTFSYAISLFHRENA